MKHHIIGLDAFVAVPPLDIDYDVTIIADGSAQYEPQKLQAATILMSSAAKVTREMMHSAPGLQLIHCNGVGTDHVDKDAVRELGLTLCHVPAQNTDSVSEHAFALFTSLRRRIMPLHQYVLDGKLWPATMAPHKQFPRLPRTHAEETLVRKNIERIGKALGMRVLVAERKGASVEREGRIKFHEALEQGTVFIIVAPLDDTTRDMISTLELETMDSSALLINTGRGGIINEQALAEALKKGTIEGAATDVFSTEPATKENSPLLDPSIPNLIMSPHIGWFSSRTISGTLKVIKANLEAFAKGQPQNRII